MNHVKRLAVITTHPIQYNAPLFRLISQEKRSFIIKVFYTAGYEKDDVYDPDFKISFTWDIPLLEGYEHTFVNNISKKPGTRHFNAVINPTLVNEIKEWKADALLVYGWSFSSHLRAMRYFHSKIPVLFRGDSNLRDEPFGFSVKKLVRRLFLRWVYRYTDYALYTGEANKHYYLAHGLKRNQLLFSPHAVDNSRFTSDEQAHERKAKEWRAESGIKKNAFVFLFAGKLTKKKDPETLIKSFIALSQKNTALIIAGNGELETELKEKYKHKTDIFFIPFQNQRIMPVVYRLANIFVLPSKGPGETWGLAVNEAMACSRGVIVSDKCGCAPDLVNPGKNGYIFHSGNAESLQSCMKLCLCNYAVFGVFSHSLIQNYSYQATIHQLEQFFKKPVLQ